MSDAVAPSAALARGATPRWFIPSLLAILLVAGAVRAPLVDIAASSFRLTEALNLEEAENIRISSGMLHKDSLNPHAFEYPSLYYYLSLAMEKILVLLGQDRWSAFLIGARLLSLAFGLGTILLCGMLALRLGGPTSGLLAAMLVAFDRTSIEISTLAKPNSAQVFFVVAGLLTLVSLATAPRLRTAMAAAGLFALATASKWLGLLAIPGIAFAAAIGTGSGGGRGLRGVCGALWAGVRRPISPLTLLAPAAAFIGVFLLCVPFTLLSVREFGMGFAQVLLAQGSHRRPLPWWVSLQYLEQSLGPIAFGLSLVGLVWALIRVARWDGSRRANGLLVLSAWIIGYGGLVLFAFARLPSYVDLLVPALAVVAGCAWLGAGGLIHRRWIRIAVLALGLAGGALSNGDMGLTRAHALSSDTRVAAGRWLAQQAADTDVVLADQGAFVPDPIRNVHWNAWGGPDRIVYDETKTWGSDRAWPEWYGGHRQLLFRNAKWSAPESALVSLKPRWVVTTSEWAANRVTPPSANDWASPGYDRALSDGSAGYAERIRFSGKTGPTVVIYERNTVTP